MRLASSGSNHTALIALALVACAKPSAPPDGGNLPPIAVPVRSVSAAASSPASAAPPAPAEQGIVVDLLDDGKVTIDGVEVAADAVKEAFAKKPRAEIATFRGGPGTEWKRVVHLLDEMKQAGNREFVLAIRNDAARRTKRIQLPKASPGMFPPPLPPSGSAPSDFVMDRVVSVTILRDGKVLVDGTEVTGPLRARLEPLLEGGTSSSNESKPRVIVQADAQAPYSVVVDIAVLAQEANALVAFAVAVDAPPSRSGSPSPPPPLDLSRPRPKPKAFDACPFPPASDKAAVDSAVVTIRVKVDAAGKPTDVTVVKDPGHGFGAAAKTCATKAAFDPARDPSGNAIPGELVMRVRFER